MGLVVTSKTTKARRRAGRGRLGGGLVDDVQDIGAKRHHGSAGESHEDARAKGAGVMTHKRPELSNEKSAASDTNSVSSLHDVSLFGDYNITRVHTEATTFCDKVVTAGPPGAFA